MRTTPCICAFLLALAIPLAGCGTSTPPVAGLAMIEHNPVALHNYTIAREYSATGRYELAREHFLLAYAAAGDDSPMQDALHRELKAVDLMIKTLR